MITEYDFEQNYEPSETMEFTDIDLYLAKHKLTPNHVWSIVEGDNGNLYAVANYRVVNVINYVVTKRAWFNELEEAEWYLDETEVG